MSDLLRILSQVVVPLVLIAGIGYLFYRRAGPHVETLSKLAFYVLNPCLIFNALVHTSLPTGDLLRLMTLAALTLISTALVSAALARALRFDAPLSSAFMLVGLGTNSGNYGLAICLFAFGEPGLQQGVIFFFTASLLASTLGVFVASRGTKGTREALANVLTVPLAYAAIGAMVVRLIGLTIPAPLTRALELTGQGAVPVMLLVLGMQLARTQVNQAWGPVSVAVVLKLVIAPLLAAGWVAVLGVGGLSRQVGLVQAGTPAAVTSAILATQYNARPQFVASVVLVSTVFSLLTMTLLLSWVG